jgi:hypothetical protein
LPRCAARFNTGRIRRFILSALGRNSQRTLMTSLIAWVGADSRGPSSVYFASDSRITWPGAGKWDHGRKLFACRRYPHIFGYCGDVLFPTQTLSQITEMIDSGLIAANPFDTIDSYTEKIVAIIEAALNTYPPPTKQRFDVLYCMREGEFMQSRFHLRQITFDPVSTAIVLPIEIPSQSRAVAVLGSGSQSVRDQLHLWESSQVRGASRSVFSAFCDALRSGNDPRSGGHHNL